MIILSGSTLANKAKDSGKLLPTDAKVYQNNVVTSLDNIPKENVQISSNNINKVTSINSLSAKKQILVQTTFKQGDKGNKVKEIQQKLNKFGYKLYVDGNFGCSTYS